MDSTFSLVSNNNQLILFDYSKEKESKQIDLVKERASLYGVDTLLNFEALSLLTGISLEKLRQFSTLNELMEFQCTLTLTKTQRIKLEAFFSMAKRFSKEEKVNKSGINSPESIASLVMDDMKSLKKEEFRIVLLNTKHDVIKISTVSVGTLNSSLVHPREVFKEAILNSSAKIILCHNHPSGDPKPSVEDNSITKRLVDAGKLIGIEVLDHIIIGYNGYFSFKENELI